MTEGSILTVARSASYAVGANRKGRPAGLTWAFLLPTLELGRVAVVGTPDPASAERLAELATDVTSGLPRGDDLDLIWLAADGAPPDLDRADLLSRLSPTGVVVDERPGAGSSGGEVARYRVLRRGSDAIVATPVDAPAVETWLHRRGLDGAAPRPARGAARRAAARVVTIARRLDPGARGDADRGATDPPVSWGRLDILGPGLRQGPPSYLRDMATADGVDIARHRSALSGTGRYRTQKVLVPLFEPDGQAPRLVVKLTRHPSVNERLATELDGLRRLATAGPAIAERVPGIRFAGHHAGLLAVGETALDGERFVAPDPRHHPLAADAVGWLTELGAATAERVPPSAAADALDALVETYTALDGPGRDLRDRLRAQVDRIRAHPAPFPVVVQHGDPGTWNLLALPGDRTGFLDWENVEMRGMPLWDIVYLLRSLAVGGSPRRPFERRLGHVRRTFLDDSPFTPFIVDAVTRYCARVGLARDLIEPLYHLGWMYQALKETTRLSPGRLGDGHFFALLRLGLERRGSGTLDRLFRESST